MSTKLTIVAVAHITQTASALENRFRKQSRRWLRHQLKRPGRGGIPYKVEQEIYYFLKTSETDRLSADARQALARLETERAGAREAAAAEEMEWVDDWFDAGGGCGGLELDVEGDEGGQRPGEAENSEYEQEGRGRVFLSPVPGAGPEGGEVLCSEGETEEDKSMKLPFRGFVSGVKTR